MCLVLMNFKNKQKKASKYFNPFSVWKFWTSHSHGRDSYNQIGVLLIVTGFAEPRVLEWRCWVQQITFSPMWCIFTQESLMFCGLMKHSDYNLNSNNQKVVRYTSTLHVQLYQATCWTSGNDLDCSPCLNNTQGTTDVHHFCHQKALNKTLKGH